MRWGEQGGAYGKRGEEGNIIYIYIYIYDPKSPILMPCSVERNRFSGLRSRCRKLAEWMWFRPFINPVAMCTIESTEMHVPSSAWRSSRLRSVPYVCVCVCVCVYVCMYACMYVCMYMRMYVYIRMYVCMYIHTYVCVCVCVCVCQQTAQRAQYIYTYI